MCLSVCMYSHLACGNWCLASCCRGLRMFALAPQRFPSHRSGDRKIQLLCHRRCSTSPTHFLQLWFNCSIRVNSYCNNQTQTLQISRLLRVFVNIFPSVRAWSRASIICWWQFNWAIMAILVPTTSLQPYDSHSFIRSTGAPGARTANVGNVLWPLLCKNETSWPFSQLPLCLAGIP